jgi:biopolymer transport protein TolQ
MTTFTPYCASSSIFFRSFFTSDSFGKGIFIALFILSLLTWYILITKFIHYKYISQQTGAFKKLAQAHEQKILQLPITKMPSLNPFACIYASLQKNSLKLLKKNQYFAKNSDAQVTLSVSDLEHLRLELESIIDKEGLKLSKNLFILSTIVSLAPFLGILGTVWGILISLSSMQSSISSLGNAGVLAGLSTALATTVLGLVIAIPALISYNYLKNRHELVCQEMDLFGYDILSKITLNYKQVES